MTKSETDIRAEEREIREGGPLPGDLDWSTQYRIFESVQQGSVTIRPDWSYGIEHEDSGIDAIITDDGETIYDLFDHNIIAAYRFRAEMRNGQILILGIMHPAVSTENGTIYAIDDEVIAKAQIHPTLLDPRSAKLVQAYAETNGHQRSATFPDDEPDALAADHYLPVSDHGVEYEVMVEVMEEHRDFPQPDWQGIVSDAKGMPKDMNPDHGHEDILLDIFGGPHVARLEYRINHMGQVVITGSVHPASGDGDAGDAVHARAEITVRTEDTRLAAAMRQYVRTQLTRHEGKP